MRSREIGDIEIAGRLMGLPLHKCDMAIQFLPTNEDRVR